MEGNEKISGRDWIKCARDGRVLLQPSLAEQWQRRQEGSWQEEDPERRKGWSREERLRVSLVLGPRVGLFVNYGRDLSDQKGHRLKIVFKAGHAILLLLFYLIFVEQM